MLKILLMILGLSSMAVFAQNTYYNQPVTLKGKILIIKSLDDEQYKNAKYPAITLNQQLIVDSNDPDDYINQGRVKTKLLQLVDSNEKRHRQYYKSNGRNITVYCEELFRQHTIHHNTKVLCVVKDVKWE